MRKLSVVTVFLILIVSCGVQEGGDQKDGISDSDHRVFVTSSTYNGNLGGFAGADSRCKEAADNSGLERTYKAIVSTSTSDAEVRLNITGGVYMFTNSSTRVLIASSGVDLWGATTVDLLNSINISEIYSSIISDVWTGTNSEGGQMATDTCSDWASTAGNGFYGNPTKVNADWVEDSPDNCSSTKHLYCISVID